MSILVLFDVALTLLHGRTKGQIGHLLHFLMPGIFLTGLLLLKGGTFALISLSLILGGVCMQPRGGGGTPPLGGGQCSPWSSSVFSQYQLLMGVLDHNG